MHRSSVPHGCRQATSTSGHRRNATSRIDERRAARTGGVERPAAGNASETFRDRRFLFGPLGIPDGPGNTFCMTWVVVHRF